MLADGHMFTVMNNTMINAQNDHVVYEYSTTTKLDVDNIMYLPRLSQK